MTIEPSGRREHEYAYAEEPQPTMKPVPITAASTLAVVKRVSNAPSGAIASPLGSFRRPITLAWRASIVRIERAAFTYAGDLMLRACHEYACTPVFSST
jgi:hypothetical protein